MTSWFSSLAQSASSFADKVKDSMPVLDSEALQKLTLTTPELTAQRQKFADEERRRNMVRNRLAGMLPWETRDPERDILVDECREAILKLSASKETFTGPWQMPGKGIKISKKENRGIDGEKEDDGEDEEEEQDDLPSKESQDQLSKLEPLPPLLSDFDLDSHVGLIQRLLKEDPQLVVMQSTLSGGGERERIFWKNYFFHCAFTRYEAGLSIDEIWSDEQVTGSILSNVHEDNAAANASAEEETISFETGEQASQGTEKTPTEKDASEAGDSAADKQVAREGSDFDMVEDLDDIGSRAKEKDDDVVDAVDYELDELEAEIARELED